MFAGEELLTLALSGQTGEELLTLAVSGQTGDCTVPLGDGPPVPVDGARRCPACGEAGTRKLAPAMMAW